MHAPRHTHWQEHGQARTRADMHPAGGKSICSVHHIMFNCSVINILKHCFIQCSFDFDIFSKELMLHNMFTGFHYHKIIVNTHPDACQATTWPCWLKRLGLFLSPKRGHTHIKMYTRQSLHTPRASKSMCASGILVTWQEHPRTWSGQGINSRIKIILSVTNLYVLCIRILKHCCRFSRNIHWDDLSYVHLI